MSSRDRRANRPRRNRDNQLPEPRSETDNTDVLTPKFCLKYLGDSHDVRSLSQEQQARFACALQDRAAMTWRQIKLAHRHGHGSELIPRDKIKPFIPNDFRETPKFMVLRYDGNLPMVGVRVRDVFHICWIEARYGDVYDH